MSGKTGKKPTKKATATPKKAKRAASVVVAPLPTPTPSLTPRQQNFVEHFVNCQDCKGNATAAAKHSGYSEKTAGSIGQENLTKPEIAQAIQKLRESTSERLQISQEDVLREWWDLVKADPRDLVEIRRDCCRFCYGRDHLHQYTAHEWENLLEENQAKVKKWEENGQQGVSPAAPSPKGGTGFDPRKEPSPDCPECFGEGVLRTVVKDMRKLSRQARRLLAGVRTTKDGVEIKTHDPFPALTNVAKHLGMLVERMELSNFDYENATDAQLEAIKDGRNPHTLK